MRTLKNVKHQTDQKEVTPKRISRKAKIILESVSKQNQTALNKPLQSIKIPEPEYTLVGIMNLRRTKHIPDATIQKLVLSSKVHEHLLILGIKSRLTWDELLRNIINDYIQNNPISD